MDIRKILNNKLYIGIGVLLISIFLLIVILVVGSQNNTPSTQETQTESMESENGTQNLQSSEDESQETESETEQKIERILADMTLEEKIYQMFVVLPEAISGSGTVTSVDSSFKSKLEQYPVGGIIYMASNLVDTQQTKSLLMTTQSYGKEVTGLPLFQCVDEEGGRVARIANNPAFGVTNVGSMSEVTSATEAYEIGAYISSYLKELGFNFDFAPNADVLTNSENQVISDRSFGSDPDVVTEYAVAYSNGLHSNGILSTFKHFPGHGATEGDTHEGYAYTNKTYEELLQAELKPFLAAKENGVDAVMVAHISVPNVVGDNTPCTLSAKTITDILRNEIGYEGLVVTDALNMGAISKQYTSAEAAVLSVQAGADILLMPQDFHEAVSGIQQAISNGAITEERINESVRRIIRVKLGL